MKFKPMSLKDANAFVHEYHRHNKPVTGHKFSIGLVDEQENIIGVAIAGRPIARMLDNGMTIEILRVCVPEGHKNVCSQLYARIKRICELIGYESIITYTLKSESQSSLKAIGARIVKEIEPQQWGRPSRGRQEQPVCNEPKFRWELSNTKSHYTTG